jgi:ADP-ribose pyrophosphatase YjhB (NUDIX family)
MFSLVNSAILWQYGAMDDIVYPRLSVTVSVFTAFDHTHPFKPTAAQLFQGTEGTDEFGMGLWVLTRKANESGVYPQAPSGRRVLPTSLVRADESLVDTARRLIKDDLGIEAKYKLRQNRIFDEITPGENARVISLSFWAFVHIDALAPLLGGKDQVGLELVSSSDFLRRSPAAEQLSRFDGVSRFGRRIALSQPQAHFKHLSQELWGTKILEANFDDMVFYAWRDMRYGFTDRFDPFRFLGTAVLDKEFRLTDLRELYQVVRGQDIQSDQFRRMATGSSSFLKAVGSVDTSGSRPGKPAALYSLR